MDISLILLILGFLIVTYLIFKFIKKVVLAILTFVILIILIIGGVFGLVALDINNLASQNNFNVNLIYGSLDSPMFGLTIPIVNKSVVEENVSGFDIKSINGKAVRGSKEDFYVFIHKNVFNSILSDNDSYYLIGTKGLKIMSFKVETKLSKSEVLNIINSSSPIDSYVNVIYSENKFPEVAGVSAKSLIKKELEAKLKERNLNLEQALFISVLDDLKDNPNVALEFIKGFKNGSVEIYPDRLTFKLVKFLPISTIMNYFQKS